jgi:hypothetical protein
MDLCLRSGEVRAIRKSSQPPLNFAPFRCDPDGSLDTQKNGRHHCRPPFIISTGPPTQKSYLSMLSFVNTVGGPRRIWLPLMIFNLPSFPASNSVSPGFSFPSTTARIA